MLTTFEPRIRRVVSDTLGVDEDDLSFASSLTDDLAADSADLLQLLLALEAELDVPISDYALRRVRTYGDLVATVSALVSRPAAPPSEPTSVPFWACIAADGASASLQRTGLLTPYAAETLTDDARAAGRGARLEMRVPASTSDSRLAHLKRRFGRLIGRGVRVSIGRADYRGVVPAPAADLAWDDRGTQACARRDPVMGGVAPAAHSSTPAPPNGAYTGEGEVA